MHLIRLVLGISFFFGSTVSFGEKSRASWTILVYVAGDEEEARRATISTIKRMEQTPGLAAGGPVNIVVQFDDVGDDPNYRYLLYKAEKTSRKLEIQSRPLSEVEIKKHDPDFQYGEKDSGNVLTLKSFLKWGIAAYPADHYALFDLGHTWGTVGANQDFFVKDRTGKGKELDKSTLMKLYEIRRAIEEIKHVLPQKMLDLLFFDSCIMGQLDVALEFKDVTRYFAATSVEMPLYSIPYEKVFSVLINALKKYPKPTPEMDTWITENAFLKPLISLYVKSHGPGGSLSPLEKQVDVTSGFALRTSRLNGVEKALKAFVEAIPLETRQSWLNLSSFNKLDDTTKKDEEMRLERWRHHQVKGLLIGADSDNNADLFHLSTLFQAYFEKEYRISKEQKWQDALKATQELKDSLGYHAVNETVKTTEVRHLAAAGAFAHVEIDHLSRHPGLIACLTVKNFVLLNSAHPDLWPTFFDEDGKKINASELECHDLFKEVKNPLKFNPKLNNVPVPIRGFFGIKLQWPHGVPMYMTNSSSKDVPVEFEGDEKQKVIDGRKLAKRVLSIWIPKKPKARLERTVYLRMPGTRRIMLEYIQGNPLSYMERISGYRSQLLIQERFKMLPYQIVTEHKDLYLKSDPHAPGLYVVVAQSNGSYFKHGMGIYLNTRFEPDNRYAGGRRPIERVEPSPFAWSLEKYFQKLVEKDAMEQDVLQGAEFYNLHKIRGTGWPKFLFGLK